MKIKTSDRKGNKLKWNFAMGLLHGIFFNGGMGFSDPNTVLPAFINSLTNSKVLIGLFASTVETKGSFSRLGSVLPQLFVANKLETKIHKKPLLITAIVVRALCWGILAGLIFCFNGSQTFFLLLSSFLLLALFTFMGGVASIPFMDIWGKALPSNLRGRFFGYRQLLGGILAIGAGFVVQQILSNKEIPFPKNFSFLFFLSFIFISFSYIALGLVKEPVEEVYKRVVKFRHFLREAIATLRDDRNYQRFLLVQFLRGTCSLALPFYVIYAKDILKINLGMVGIFISAQMGRRIIIQPLMGIRIGLYRQQKSYSNEFSYKFSYPCCCSSDKSRIFFSFYTGVCFDRIFHKWRQNRLHQLFAGYFSQ